MGWLIYRQGWNADTASYLPLLGVMAVVLLMVLPNMVEFALPAAPRGKPAPIGVPIRGFGVMMMVAMIASVGLAMHRACQMGIDPEAMTSLAMWMIFPGII